MGGATRGARRDRVLAAPVTVIAPGARDRTSSDVLSPEGRSHGLAHRDHGRLAGGGDVLADMKLDAVGHVDTAPYRGRLVIALLSSVGAGSKCGCEWRRHAAPQRLPRKLLHLA